MKQISKRGMKILVALNSVHGLRARPVYLPWYDGVPYKLIQLGGVECRVEYRRKMRRPSTPVLPKTRPMSTIALPGGAWVANPW